MRKIAARLGIFVCLAALAACGGGGSNFMPAPSPLPSPSSTATPAPVSTSVALSATALNAQPVATAIPAPSGYVANVSLPVVTAPANTTIQISSSTGAPASLVGLQSEGRAPQGLRTMSSGQYSGIFYDTVVPSQNVAVAGKVSFTQSFPNGGLTAGTQYYLAFYDATQTSPAWATITGPVTPTGNSLTFSGTIGSFTLLANKLYGFAIFSLASPSATPPPATAQTVGYLGTSNQIQEVTAAGTVVSTLGISSMGVGLDDAANIYALNQPAAPSPAPSATASPTAPPETLLEYPAGSTTPSATYNMSRPTITQFVASSGAGEVMDASSGQGSTVFDIWDPGQSGNPSRTFTVNQYGFFAFAMGHDGTIYIPSNLNGQFKYDIYAPGSSTPTRTITESIVPAAQQSAFAPNYIAVGPDGTLYVTEYSYAQPDPNAGLYIYPPNGPEKFVATTSDSQGPGPAGVDVDASGNIYVANNNGYFDNTGSFHTDTLHDIEVFAPGGTSVLRHITGNFDPYPLSVAPDGTMFFSSFNPTVRGGATLGVAAGSSTPIQIAAYPVNSIPIYNGYQETLSSRRHVTSFSGAAAAAHAGTGALRHYLQSMHRIP